MLIKRSSVACVITLLVASATLICASYAYVNSSYSDSFDEYIITEENNKVILNTDGFDLGNAGIRIVKVAGTTKNSTENSNIDYSSSVFTNSQGDIINDITIKIGTITLKDSEGTPIDGAAQFLFGTLSNKVCTKTDATTAAEIIIHDGTVPGTYNIFVKYTLAPIENEDYEYSLPGYTVTIQYNDSI